MTTLTLPRGSADTNWVRAGRRNEPTLPHRAWIDGDFRPLWRGNATVTTARMRAWFGLAIVGNPPSAVLD